MNIDLTTDYIAIKVKKKRISSNLRNGNEVYKGL
jgi:hypothetical protein